MPGSSPAARAGTEAPAAVDRETGWPGVSPRTESMGTVMGLAKGRSSAPVAAGACGVVGKEDQPVRVRQMTGGHEFAVNKVPDLLVAQGKAQCMATAAGPSEAPGHAGRNRAAAPAAHNPLVPAVHMMASEQTSRMALKIITLMVFPTLIYIMWVNRQK